MKRPTYVRNGEAMSYARRIGIYYRQNGVWRLTPAQSRRLRKKANSGRGA